MREAATVVLGFVVANLAIADKRFVLYEDAAAVWRVPVSDGESVEDGGSGGGVGDGVNHTLGMVAVQNGSMGLEVSLRQVEVERLVALEAAIHLAVAQQSE